MADTSCDSHRLPFWRQVFSSIDAMLFPRRCVACRTLFDACGRRDGVVGSDDGGLDGLASYLCPGCFDGCRPIASPMCSQCGRIYTSRVVVDHVCGDCIRTPKPFGKARAWGAHEGALLRVIRNFKYHHQPFLARPLGILLFGAFLKHWRSNEIDRVIPVPLHPKRLRQRGFNQSRLLIHHWPRGDDGATVIRPTSDWLIRTRRTRSQTGLRRKERQANMRGAFALQGRPPLASKHVLLVDDVYTTGATVAECARVLLAGGARRVDVLTLARAM